MKSLLTILLSLTLTASAYAEPFTLDFTSGGLTGFVTASSYGLVDSPAEGAITAWNITAPLGAWSSTDQAERLFEWRNFGNGFIFQPMKGPAGETNLFVETNGPTNITPGQSAGTYQWHETLVTGDTFSTASGTGTWSREVVNSVPIPGTLWLLGSGLVLLAVWRARRRVS